MSVHVLNNTSDYNRVIQSNGLTVLDFTAAWCGPCRLIAPKVDEIAAIYGNVSFYKVDVDEAQDIAARANVSAMPTFQFYKDGRLVNTVVGADVAKLKSSLAQYACIA